MRHCRHFLTKRFDINLSFKDMNRFAFQRKLNLYKSKNVHIQFRENIIPNIISNSYNYHLSYVQIMNVKYRLILIVSYEKGSICKQYYF